MNFIKLLILITFLSGCSITPSFAGVFPYESFVKVNVKTSILECYEDKKSNISKCTQEDFYSVGSGSVVGRDKNHTYVLTAGHVCITGVENMAKVNRTKTIINTSFILENRHSKSFNATVHAIHPEFLKGNDKADLCLLKTSKQTKMPIIKISHRTPKMGDKVYNVSAPGGFFIPPAIPIFSGHFSGRINEWHNLVTIPAIGGSSGSPVVNEHGRLIGMIFAANLRMHHLSISINHEVIASFLKENLYRQPPL